jgi:parallel beta-helix repeat protein
VITFKNASFITLQGLIIEHARATGITLKDSNDCNIIGCTIRNHGGTGIQVDGGKKVSIKGCDVYGEGDGGISITGGDRKTLTPGEHLVENCHIHHYSRWNRTYRPGISQNGVGNRSAHNLIHDAPHQGMAFGGNDQIIEFNEFHNVCEESNDAGVMYAWNDWAGRGNEVRFNYMHHNYGHESKGCSGVYVDDNFSSAHIHGNLFYHMYRAIQMGGGRDYKIENNTFVDCIPALDLDARGLGWRAYGKEELIKKLEKWPYKEDPWKSKYPELLTLIEDEPMAPKGVLVSRNIGVRGKWLNIDGKAKPYIEFKENWVGEDDPGFVDLAKANFNLKEDAEALKGGFKTLPIAKMGLYESPERASWPVEHSMTVRELKKPAPPAVKPHPSKPLNIAKAKAAPTIDGEVKADEWTAAPSPVSENTDRSKIKTVPCQAQFAHDEKTLYVAVTIPLAKPVKDRTHEWGKSDGIELCLRSLDGKPGPIAVIHGFMDGTKEATGDGAAPKPMIEALNKSVTFAAKVTDTQWTGEWAIPLEAAGIAYKPGVKVGFNIGIHRTENKEWIQWTGALGATFKLENAGSLILE